MKSLIFIKEGLFPGWYNTGVRDEWKELVSEMLGKDIVVQCCSLSKLTQLHDGSKSNQHLPLSELNSLRIVYSINNITKLEPKPPEHESIETPSW